MTVFIIIGAIGLALLVVSFLFDGLFDLDGGGFISIPGIAIALTVFGASGALATSLSLDIVWAYVIAIGIGLVAYIGSALLIRSLARSSDGEARDVTGDTGIAKSDITSASGEVALDAAGEIERRQAFADEPISEGTRIRVVQAFGSRIKVEPLVTGVVPDATSH
ncbi:hypothetical protein F8O01_04220 [Pseudoclavibacter chungangensis]|uniref:NfeD-like C-terminal domain-containing protein n=1 Tax=Pseudoclavibacter chungangensis TaxID=587635 RepID=A0A7J5BZQ8_9MICO|nr:NfeD family protein [Pseudoclavibacter chungangensis]KAB1660137.1 hypothetical protein F8O01_04220 [Pseudoclavibacter chungangensis]NYJ66755.1 membrane protein implicated in regulation of membrane protease activity [Pseudoclavibacter chungangensis]